MIEPQREHREEIVSAFPELTWIKEPRLREHVIKVWDWILRRSQFPSLSSCPFTTAETNPCSLVDHTRAVVSGCRAAAEVLQKVHSLSIDLDLLIAAALIHDASKALEYEPAPEGSRQSVVGAAFPHAVYTAVAAREVGMPDDLVSAVLTHTLQSRAAPNTVEGIILRCIDLACADAIRWQAGLPLNLSTLSGMRV